MIIWDSLNLTQQFLLASAIRQQTLACSIQRLGEARRWSGVGDAAALRSYTESEERVLIPEASSAALAMVDSGWLGLRDQRDVGLGKLGPVLPVQAAQDVLADEGRWIWTPENARDFQLCTDDATREELAERAWPTADVGDMPTWDELTREEQELLVCAAEFSGYLTGQWGIWLDPPADLTESERLAWVDGETAPLLPFLRKGWIEVRHIPEPNKGYSVIPIESLRDSLCDPVLRYQGDELGVGFTCVFTFAGYAVWRGGWSRDWSRRLRFD